MTLGSQTKRALADRVVGAHYDDRTAAHGLARLYESPSPLGDFYRDRMKRIAELLSDAGGDLLDAGCGTGQMLRFLRDTRPGQFGLTGLDRSASVIEEARLVVDADPSVRLVVGRVEEMPFPEHAFDVVLAMGLLEYVASLEGALREIARVTRPGGLVVCTMQNPRSPYRLWDASVHARMRRRRGDRPSPVLRRVPPGRLRSSLREAGAEPVSVVHYNFNLLLPPLDSRLPRLALWLKRRIETAARGPLRVLANDYIVVARKPRGDGGGRTPRHGHVRTAATDRAR
jgi:ubiquinone/menaquinone biosynthesis C-methylase UbiE